MTTHRTTAEKCPSCGEAQDALTSMIGDGKPEPGSFTVCWKCGEICVLDEDRKRKPMSREDYEKLSEEERGNLLKLQTDARAGKINPYKDDVRVVDLVNKGWDAQGFVGPFSDAVAKGLADLRKACEILDTACVENAKDVPDTIIRDATEACRSAMIHIAFEFTPPADYIRTVASKIVEGPKRDWK